MSDTVHQLNQMLAEPFPVKKRTLGSYSAVDDDDGRDFTTFVANYERVLGEITSAWGPPDEHFETWSDCRKAGITEFDTSLTVSIWRRGQRDVFLAICEHDGWRLRYLEAGVFPLRPHTIESVESDAPCRSDSTQ